MRDTQDYRASTQPPREWERAWLQGQREAEEARQRYEEWLRDPQQQRIAEEAREREAEEARQRYEEWKRSERWKLSDRDKLKLLVISPLVVGGVAGGLVAGVGGAVLAVGGLLVLYVCLYCMLVVAFLVSDILRHLGGY